MNEVIVVVGAGQIDQTVARRVGSGKHVLLASLSEAKSAAAAQTLRNAGFKSTATTVDVSKRESVQALVKTATSLGEVTGLIHAEGVSPSQAPIEAIRRVDLYGTALVLKLFGAVITRGGSGVVIVSQSGHRLLALMAEQDKAIATTPVEQLPQLDCVQPRQVSDTLHAYRLSKRANALRVAAEAMHWGQRGARINTISPGIIITPLANDELTGLCGAGYRRMIEGCPVSRAGTPDELGNLATLLMGLDGTFIIGSDFLIDGGVTAAFKFGDLGQPAQA